MEVKTEKQTRKHGELEQVIENLPMWHPGEKYAGETFGGYLVLAHRDGYSPAYERLVFNWLYASTADEDFPMYSFKHWRRRYVSMLLIPPKAGPDVMVEAAVAYLDAREEAMMDTEKARKQTLQDADSEWKAMKEAERKNLLTSLNLSPLTATNSLPPTGNGPLIPELAKMYAERYRESFGGSLV